MHPIDSGLKENFFQWRGRLNRKRYLKRLLALLLAAIAVYVIAGLAATSFGDYSMRPDKSSERSIKGLLMLLRFPITISGYMLMMRRLHDVGLSGFFALLSFIPFVNLGLALYVLFKKGTPGDNNYGPDPLDTGDSSDAPDAPAQPVNPYARATYADAPTDIAPPKKEQD